MSELVDLRYLQNAGNMDPVIAAIQKLGDDVAASRARKEKLAEEQRQFDARNKLDAERTKAISDREARMERGQNSQMEVENSKRRMAADKDILSRIASGDTAGARQLDAGYAEVNPADQSVTHGRGLEIKDRDLGPEPQAPADLPDGAEGPIPSPQEVRRAGMIDRSHGQTLTPQSEYADAMDARDARSKLGPVVKLGGVETSMDEVRNNARRQSAEDFGKVGDALQMEMRQAMESGDPLLREQATRRAERYSQLKAGVESGALKPFDAMKMLTSSEALDDKYRENRVHDKTVGQFGIEKQRVANAKPSADRQRTAGTGGVDRKDLTAAETSLNNFQKQWNLSADRAEDTRLRGLLKNKDVSVVQRSLSDVLSRSLAGQKGVLTDADINRLQGHMGGYWGDVQNWISKGGTGDLDPDVFAKLMQGVDVVLQNHETNRAAAKAAFDKDYGDGSAWGSLNIGDHLKRKRFEFFGDDAATQVQGGSSAVDDIMAEWRARKAGRK